MNDFKPPRSPLPEWKIAYEVWQGDVPIKMGVIIVSAENIDEARKRAQTIIDDVLMLMFPGARIVITDDLDPHTTGL